MSHPRGSSFRQWTTADQVDHVAQMLLAVEDQVNAGLARLENEERLGRRARYTLRDLVGRTTLACWDVLAYCKRRAAASEAAEADKEGLDALFQTVMELSLVAQLLPALVDAILQAEDPIPPRAEGWPRLRDFRKEEDAVAPPTGPSKPDPEGSPPTG